MAKADDQVVAPDPDSGGPKPRKPRHNPSRQEARAAARAAAAAAAATDAPKRPRPAEEGAGGDASPVDAVAQAAVPKRAHTTGGGKAAEEG